MAETAISVSHTRLREFMAGALGAMKMPRPIAEVTAGLMVRTDLRGVDSHGIGMLPRYHEEPTGVRDEVATGLLDGQKGLGHYGVAANYSTMALESDMIGLSVTNSPYVAMVPTFGARRCSRPTRSRSRRRPDATRRSSSTWRRPRWPSASSRSPRAGTSRFHRAGRSTEGGTPTTDPFVALKHRLVTPLGGTRDLGSHKGPGLGVMVDILSGVMSGAVYGDLFYRTDRQERRVQDVGHCFAAIDPARFRPLAEFKRDMDDMFEALKSSPKADGHTRIWIAGEPDAECEAKRRHDGIPLAPALVSQCNELAEGLGVPPLT